MVFPHCRKYTLTYRSVRVSFTNILFFNSQRRNESNNNKKKTPKSVDTENIHGVKSVFIKEEVIHKCEVKTEAKIIPTSDKEIKASIKKVRLCAVPHKEKF